VKRNTNAFSGQSQPHNPDVVVKHSLPRVQK